MGALLGEEDLVPEWILSSTARRTHETVDLLLSSFEREVECSFDSELYLASPDQCLLAASRAPDQHRRVMVVAHNPGLEDLASHFQGAYVRMPTAAIVSVELSIASWRELDNTTLGQVGSVWRPKELRA